MATLEDIVAATKILSENPEPEMKENQTRVLNLRKCDGSSESDVVIGKPVVEATVEDELVKNGNGKNGDEDSLLENGECRSIGDKELSGIGIEKSNVDADGVGEGDGTGEKVKDGDFGFSVGDFVWGKIKSHPWWPGQVNDPKNASEFALKHKQDGRFLVAFFGDGSCSWCSPSQLIPYVDNFSEMSRGSNSKSFLNAVQRSTDEIGRLIELEMTCKCVSKERKDSLAKTEETNAALRAGVLMPEPNECHLSFPKYEPADVFQRVVQLAKVVSVGNALELAVLRSWLSAFYYFNGGHLLPVCRDPFHVEGLEDKNRDANGVTNDFSVPIEVPIFGPQEDDWLSSPVVRSANSQAQSETKVMHKRKQRSVAEIMGENKTVKPKSRKLASLKESSDVEKSTTTRKRKKDNNGEVKGAGNEKPSSTGKEGGKRKAEVSGKPNEIDVTVTQNSSEAIEETETVTSPRERKKSKYLSPPYTNLAWRLGNSSFKSESQIEKTTQAEEHGEEQENAADQPISKSLDNESKENRSNGKLETPDTSVDVGLQTAKKNKKLSFPASDVDVLIDEFLSEIELAALDPFYLSTKGSLDTVWGFVSALRSSTYVHGPDYKLYHKRANEQAKKNTKSADESTPRASKKQRKSDSLKKNTQSADESTPGASKNQIKSDTSKKNTKSTDESTPGASKKQRKSDISKKNTHSADESTPKASKKQRESDTLKSKKAPQTPQTVEDKTLSCLISSFTPGSRLPSKKEVVELFSKFGSLNKKKTKVETDSHSIQIVYKNDSDAEAAYKSSLSQSPFGSENVTYTLQRSPKPIRSRSKAKQTSEKPEASQGAAAGGLVGDMNTMKQKLEITTAIVENYSSKFSSEDETSLKEEMKNLLEKIEAVGDKVRVIAEKSSS